MALAFFLIFKYEGFNRSTSNGGENQGEEEAGLVYEDEAWNTCLEGIDPSWLLIYRIICFIVLLALIIASVAADGGAIFYFYTQWTFTLVTIYFGFGSYFSLYGCSLKPNKFVSNAVNGTSLDAEVGTYIVPTIDGSSNMPNLPKSPDQEFHTRKIAGLWGYIFQIIFQTCAGAVVLTDSVFWFILYPNLTSKDYSVDFLIFCMHSINALFLLGDTSLNCMRFPMFRFAYFVLWTAIFVIFQWIIHVCVSLWWPYPFLDLKSAYAPLWYLAVALMHFPCYGLFALIVRMKQLWLSRSFPGSSRFVR
ncbi:uncharacterized protein LOC109811778 isoform X2 [Cajanus cajan]|uniref:Transmembrane protein n=2 Tax=Cajanus cajan TaxID=3821 RepID=A0A151S9Q0_CAJCA|nr:uncharacterized protein LOC109811778 isoform X2 [Cajanus cajan]KYP51522.1 hypothetical protein KK1_026549 [Cajanus cajan]